MKKLFVKSFACLFAAFILSGCAANKQGIGTGVGLLAGGLIGSQFGSGSGKIAATILGAGAGALIGGAIGQHLDEKDKQQMVQSSQNALESAPTGKAVGWSNPDSGNSGTTVVNKTYQASSGGYCREYTQTVRVGGKVQQAYGTACRQPDGSWQVVQ